MRLIVLDTVAVETFALRAISRMSMDFFGKHFPFPWVGTREMIAFRKTHGGANCRGFSAGGGGPGSPGDNRILSNDHCSAPFSRAIFGWFGTAKVYSGTGADIVNGINYTSCQLPGGNN